MKHILLTGKIEDGGPIQWHISPPSEPEQAPQDGELQGLIDAGHDVDFYRAELQELVDGREDRMFWARGEW